jgi:GDP/UDP-N,N'-diacetylbacillosamine 2-epimerase (hydrolysing)
MINVLYVSGSRADYGPIRRVLQVINEHPDIDLKILVTGMHLDLVHGETWREIVSDGFTIAESVHGRVEGDSVTEMAASLGNYLTGMSYAISRLHPDILLVLGDRGEQLAGSIAGAFQNIVVVHLCGGSVSGSIDDSIRHAITKFAHYHLPAFQEHANRILQMGEDPEKVRVVGLPGNDIRLDVTFSIEDVRSKYYLPLDTPYILVLQHSVSHTYADAAIQIEETLQAVTSLRYPVLLANPNDDAGGRVILTKMQEYSNRYNNIQILPPLSSRELFASIMSHSGVLVGNSSSGVVEAMSLGLPVVNIGDRQAGREHLACMINVEYDRLAISNAIEIALNDNKYRAALEDFTRNMVWLDTPTEVVNCLLDVDLDIASIPKSFVDFTEIHN